MERFVIQGGNRLSGELKIHGAKNAALPIMAASLLCPSTSVLHNIPDLTDVKNMGEILTNIGARVRFIAPDSLRINCSSLDNFEIPEDLMRRMRSSFIVVGPLLSRLGRVRVTYPGGCAIGTRGIDLHLKGLGALGVRVLERRSGHIEFVADKLQGNLIYLDYPSVGATENIMMAAVAAKGTTVISNPAREPEIVDLQNFLNKLGAKVSGAGSDHIIIHGVKEMGCVEHSIIPDRIVAGTILVAAATAGGEVRLPEVIPAHFSVVIAKLREMGAHIQVIDDSVTISADGRLRSVDQIRTAPYPGFPTDMQPQMMAALATANGVSMLTEKIFDGRFKHIDELRRMGANISVDDRTAVIRGVPRLTGARVEASDLRAGAALVIAALAAEGTSVIDGVLHIDRGYVALERQLASLGASIYREKGDL